MNLERASAIVAAVLYEGYLLYPYGPASIKNRHRWTFGGVFPRDYAETTGGDPSRMQTECLIEGTPETVVEIRVRFLHVVTREIGRLPAPVTELPDADTADLSLVPSLTLDGAHYLAAEEARERDVAAPALTIARLLEDAVETHFAFPAARELEPIRGSDGRIGAALIRSNAAVAGRLTATAVPAADGVFRLTARIENLTALGASERASRALAQCRAFASTHTLLGVAAGAFVSLMDPPASLQDAARACANDGTWPVLVGPPGARDLMLSSPIILYDYPEIAAESPGDLFDGTEIDEILSLRILTMTEAEKRDMAAADSRARALLERTERLTPAELGRLHGTLRTPGPRPPAVAANGERLAVGDHVRLRPRPGRDIIDVVLRGKIAVIEAIERDFEDRVHVAVTVLDDPGRDMGLDRMPGHRFFFGPEEVEALSTDAPQ